MPSAFDCHDRVSGFDCKIRVDSHDTYGPGSSAWVVEYDFSGSSVSGLHFICLACTGTRVIGITETGEIYSRTSSGVWSKIASGFSNAGATIASQFYHYPLITCQSDGRNFVNQQTGSSSVIYRVIAGSTTAWASMNNGNFEADPLVDNTYGTFCLGRHLSGSFYSGYLWDGAASYRSVVTATGLPPANVSDDLYSGHVMTPTAYYSGTTGLTRNVIDSGSGYPTFAYQVCSNSGVCYAVHSGGYSIRAISGVDSGWQTVCTLRQTGAGNIKFGASKAANGKMYLSYLSPTAFTIDEVDLATYSISAAHEATQRIPGLGVYKEGWFCKNSTSIYFCGWGYILRKDL